MDQNDDNFVIVDFNELSPVACPCGQARRTFPDVPDFPATIHRTETAPLARTTAGMKLSAIAATILAGLISTLSLPAAEIRGLGEVTAQPVNLPGLEGLTFQCDSPAHALILLHKIGNDMSATATVPVSWQTIHVADANAPVLVRQGFGSILLAAKGNTTWVYATSGTDNLASAFAPAANSLAGAHFFDPKFTYPMFMDKFSSRGMGSWYPYGLGYKGVPNTIRDHFQFLKDNNLSIQPNAGGFLLRNLLPFIREYGRPYHFAQWLGWSEEDALMCPEDIVSAGKDFTGIVTYYGGIGFGGEKLLAYRNWVFAQQMKEVTNDPNLVDWLDPNGEVGPSPYQRRWDFSEHNRRHFADWLEHSRGYTLASLSKAWYGSQKQFSSWSQVPIPEDYQLFGLTPDSLRAEPFWKIHTGDLESGLAQGFTKPGYDDHGWLSVPMPGGQLLSALWAVHKIFWYRGVIDVPEPWLASHQAKGRIYLNVATLNGSRDYQHATKFWVNGQETGALSMQPGSPIQGFIDVTDVIRAGKNVVAFIPGDWFFGPEGTVMLGSKPMESYPFTDSHLNARYFDWREYIADCIAEQMENTYKTIRGIDMTRSIKMMAALDKDLVIPLQAKYQAFGHNTGDEGFFRPWDKHFGYPRGIPNSAESSATQVDPDRLKRWIGWFHFTGLNAFDNFYCVQDMMYKCADLWQEYLPYIHLGNRRDFKKPDIALFWSSQNNRLLERCVPLCFDLGRGDLESIGYNFVYTDDSGLRDGLDKGYPVIWDCASQVMQPETVARLKAYVEAGGTFVALEETGRHTPLQRDAWPISDLTGFKVGEIRPMTGTVNILHDQPLFTALAGKSFLNQGTSVDYSSYNYADKCIALEPVAADTQAIARYGDGAIAIGMRKLGKGRVVVLGSPFWRDSYDKGGTWWPGEGQDVFLEDLLHGLGLKPVATADTHKVWRIHYLANNGTEEYLALWNPYPDPVTFSGDWATDHPAQNLYDPKNGKPIAEGSIKDRTVHLEKMTLAPLETRVVAAAVTRKPTDALSDWFAKYALWYRPSAPGFDLKRPDLPTYDFSIAHRLEGKPVTEADLAKLDLAALSSEPKTGDGFSKDAGFSPDYQASLPDTAHFVFRAVFKVPDSWKPGQACQLNLKSFGKYATTVDGYLNGEQILTQAKTNAWGYSDLSGGSLTEVGPLLDYGKPNVLILTSDKRGYMGTVDLLHRPVAAQTMDVTGQWQVQTDQESGLSAVELPGKLHGILVFKYDIKIPAAWKGSRVFIQIEPGERQLGMAIINDEALFLSLLGVTYADVTPWVKFGQPNSLTLIPKWNDGPWGPLPLEIKKITFQKVTER